MTVDQFTSNLNCDIYIEIYQDTDMIFKGTIREFQEYYYTLGQREIYTDPYKITASLYRIMI